MRLVASLWIINYDVLNWTDISWIVLYLGSNFGL